MSSFLAAIHDRHDDIDVSATGLVVGLILGILIYVIADYAAKATGTPALRFVGALVGLIVFLVLGFDLSGV